MKQCFSIYTNFFEGDDKRGKHTPSNKLSNEIVNSVVNLLEQHAVKNTKCKKRIINDPGIRSLRHLYSIYKEGHLHDSSPSYTSFKRIFNEHSFAFPPDRLRVKPPPRLIVQARVEKNDVVQEADKEIFEDEYDYIEEHIIEDDDNLSKPEETGQEVLEPKVIVTQVPESSKFFASPSQVYEIQIIQIPIQNTPHEKCDIY